MRERVRERMERLLKDRSGFEGVLDDAPPDEKGRALTEFYATDIDAHLNSFSDDDIEKGLECDGSGDLGIDFVCQREDHYFIYQSKYRGRNHNLQRKEVLDFFNAYKVIIDRKQLEKANEDVRDLLRDFSREDSSITFSLITTGKVSETIKSLFDAQKRQFVKDFKNDKVSWRLVDLGEIKSDYRQVQSMGQSIEEEVNISVTTKNVSHGYIDLSDTPGLKDHKTIVAVVSGVELSELFKKYRHRLFNENIRGYLGSRKVNKQIHETLKTSPDLFYLYNNGISAVCSEMEVAPINKKETSFQAKCKGFQIINGAQTVASIGEFGRKCSSDTLKKVLVLIRITEGKDQTPNIVRFNNSQNVIKDSDFRSNDPIQIDLEDRIKSGKFKVNDFSKTTTFGSKKTLIYLRKRGMRLKKGELGVKLEELAKSLYAFDNDDCPRLNSSSTFLFDVGETGAYWEIFGRNGKESTTCNKDTLEKMIVVTFLNKFLRSRTNMKRKELKDQGVDKGDFRYMACTLPHHQLWAFGHLMKSQSKEEQKKIYKEIVNGDAFKKGAFVDETYKKIMVAISSLLSDEQSRKKLNFKTWQRNNESIGVLKGRLDSAVATSW